MVQQLYGTGYDTLIFRRGTAAEWVSTNMRLESGEPGYETDTGKLKIGNGVDHWSALPYFAGEAGDTSSGGNGPSFADVLALIQDHVASSVPHPVYDDGPSLADLYERAKG